MNGLVRNRWVGEGNDAKLCRSLRKIARVTRQLRTGGEPIPDTRVIKGSKHYLHPTKGYRQGPHYPTTRAKQAAMVRGRALIEALRLDMLRLA